MSTPLASCFKGSGQQQVIDDDNHLKPAKVD